MAYSMQPRRHHAAAAVQARREQEAEEAKKNESGQEQSQVSAPEVSAQVTSESGAPTNAANILATNSDRVQELEREVTTLRERLSEQSNELAAAQSRALELPEDVQKELAELRKYREDLEMQQVLDVDQEFETLDREAAAELSAKVLRPALERLEKRYEDKLRITHEELSRIQKERQERDASMTEAQKSSERSRVNAAILGAHPDFEKVLQSEQFAQFSSRPAWKGSRVTLGQLMRDEYNNGNADFVIEAMNDFKGGKPSLADIASVSSATTASIPASGVDEQQYTDEDVSLWNRQLTTGQITREEYKELRAKYKAQKVAASAA
ncbi:TPA: hypothetical protein ACHKED_003936 [Escherichia coli]|uniref:hypothetical protein n=1 Tax=Escherichia coli TaxID=562 RepID=UPI0016B0E59C|nr:hypothetical protein [Escherichia coli]HDQ6808636.1 hypothetical protein [Escherichia coli O22:H16]HDQ6829335.1 hypothetical protein [Escherichia coli O128:H2]EFA1526602.1 hypothetical protein [Escherichia coli]EFG2981127.1 hypothetical protein [Escherichia coli]EFG6327271.1 hypothetical protein [Escherichia coli]